MVVQRASVSRLLSVRMGQQLRLSVRGPEQRSLRPKRKIPGAKATATMNPPLPPPASREAAKAHDGGLSASGPGAYRDSDPPRADSRPPEVDNVAPAIAPTDKSKVSIVPPALFE